VKNSGTGLLLILFKTGNVITVCKYLPVTGGNAISGTKRNSPAPVLTIPSQRSTFGVADTLVFSKMGYKTVLAPLKSFIDTIDVVLTASGFVTEAYEINVLVQPNDDKDGVGWASAPQPQIILKQLNDSGFMVAWNGKDSAVHITKLSADFKLQGTDIIFTKRILGGFTIAPKGFGVTLVHDSVLSVLASDNAGTVLFDRLIIGNRPHTEYQAKFDPMAFGSSRLLYAGGRYVSYFAHQQNFSTNPDSVNVHQGDMLVCIDTAGDTISASGGWSWGTSHSLDERLIYDGSAFVTVSLGDAYPKGITFQRVKKLGKKTIMALDGNMAGWANGDLGGLVYTGKRYIVAFCTPQGRDTTDAGFMVVDSLGAVQRTVWLTQQKKGTGTRLNRVNAAQLGNSLTLVAWNIYNTVTKKDSAYGSGKARIHIQYRG
jgi:hypothetical protein